VSVPATNTSQVLVPAANTSQVLVPATSTSQFHGCGLEWHFLSMLRLQGGVARAAPARRAFCGPGADSIGKQSRAEQKLMPIKDEQESAFFDRPFRTQAKNAPHGCGFERHFSSMLRLQGRLERHLSSILRLRGGSSCTRRSFCSSGADSSGTRRAFCSSGANSIGTFREFCCSGASSSSHFEPSAAPGRARAAISSHLRLRARLEQQVAAFLEARQATKLWSIPGRGPKQTL